MLITSGTRGQFGNAYLSSAYVVAHALEYQYKLRLNNLGKHHIYLIGPAANQRIHLGGEKGNMIGIAAGRCYRRLTRRKITRIGPLTILSDQGGAYPLTSAQLGRIAKSGVVFNSGWKFRDRDILRKQIAGVRGIFSFKKEFTTVAEEKIRRIRQHSSHLIAVHIRMGDYMNYIGGKYFFSSAIYQRIAAEAVTASGHDPAQVVILPFSNERLDWPDELAGARVHQAGGSWWEDFLCMTMCDLIIGPPSTFSGSASLLGDVPWFQIKNKEAAFDVGKALPYLESGIRI